MPNQAPAATPRVLLVRSSGNEADAEALAAVGVLSVSDPYITVSARTDDSTLAAARDLLESLTTTDWVIATSSNGVAAWGQLLGVSQLTEAFAAAYSRGVRFAAIGEATAKMYAEFGIHDCIVASTSYAEVLAAEVIAQTTGPATAVVPLGSIALPTLTRDLAAAGWTVRSAALYDTVTVSAPPATASALNAGAFDAVLLRSPSAANAVAGWVREPGDVAVICTGQTTSAAATAAGLKVIAVSGSQDAASVARIVSETLGGANSCFQ